MAGLKIARAASAARLRDRAPVSVGHDPDGSTLARTPYLVTPPERGSLADLPFDNAAADPHAVVVARKEPNGSWRDLTAADFAAEVSRVAKGLIATGVGPGDRIALMSRTRYEWTLLDFAAWAAGAAAVPVYPTASAEQVAAILRGSHAVAVFVEDGTGEAVVTDALKMTGLPLPVRRIDTGAIDELVSEGRPVPDATLQERRAALTPGSEATVIYTSGTTGTPKGVPLTHENFLTAAANCIELLEPPFRMVSGDTPATLLFLPLAHVLGRMIEVACVQARIKIGHSPSIRPAELRPDLRSFGATFLVGVPYLFEKIHHAGRTDAEALHAAGLYDRAHKVAVAYAKAELARLSENAPGPSPLLRLRHQFYDALVYRRVRQALGGKVGYAICGGSALDPELLYFFAGAGIMIYEGYGLTETSGPATVNPPLRPRPGTVGPPIPGSAVRIAEDGEIWLSGPQVFGGYQDQGENSTGPDGWFPTGDLGRLDADGYLSITGRKKDILVTSGGKNVSPGPMEDKLRSHPLIGACMVVGDDRPYVAAIVTLDTEAVRQFTARMSPGLTVTSASADGVDLDSAVPIHPSVAAAIAGAVRETNQMVSRAESIRRVRIVAGDFTEERGLLTPSLKVKRPAVTRAYAADIEALYPQDLRCRAGLPGVGDELRYQGLREQGDGGVVLARVADMQLRLVDRRRSRRPHGDQGRAALAQPADGLVIIGRARVQQGPVVEGLGQVNINVRPVAGLAGVGGPPRTFTDHQRGLFGRGQPFGRSQDVHAVATIQQTGGRGQPLGATLEQVGAGCDGLAQQVMRRRATGQLGFKIQQQCQRVLIGAARDAASLRASEHVDQEIGPLRDG
jgi:long-chain acyl-CoA synthetase